MWLDQDYLTMHDVSVSVTRSCNLVVEAEVMSDIRLAKQRYLAALLS